MSWTDPTVVGFPVTGHRITVKDNTFGTSFTVWNTTATTATVNGQVPGHQYTFYVQAAVYQNRLLGSAVSSSTVTATGSTNVGPQSYPNVPSGAPQPSYPVSLVHFTTLADYPTGPGDIGYAYNLNQIHSELYGIEQTLGVGPLASLPFTTLAEALYFLFFNTSSTTHTHGHNQAEHENEDDHPQYALLDGSRQFTAPVTAPAAVTPSGLVTLGQVDSYGFGIGALTFGSSDAVVGRLSDSEAISYGNSPPLNTVQPLTVIGGVWYGATGPDGIIQIPFSPPTESASPFGAACVAFVFTYTTTVTNTTVFPTYNPVTDDLDLLVVSLTNATLYVTTTDGPGYYTVRSGDTLWSIAQHYYGSGDLWPRIYNANRNLIANPNLIYPNQVLYVPGVGSSSPQRFVAISWIAAGV